LTKKFITLKAVATIKPGEIVWDHGSGSVTGFAARRQRSKAITYLLKYPAAAKDRWYKIGRHGAPWTPDLARTEAKRVLGEVARGEDPSSRKEAMRKAATVADLCEQYIEAAEEGRILTRRRLPKKASTIATDKGRVKRHIVPLLGNLKISAVTRQDIEDFRDAVTRGATAAQIKTGPRGLARVTGGYGTATRTVALLGEIFSYAVKRGLRTDNPVRGVETHAYKKRDRRVSTEEFAAIGRALGELPNAWPVALAGIKFLALSGWRRGEMLELCWAEIDLPRRTARLSDSKTGQSMRPLSEAACAVLVALPRLGPLVFPSSTDPAKPMLGFRKIWLRLAKQAGLPPDVSPHVFRHTFASIAGDLGFSELTIAMLIGHRKGSTTSRYVHHADAVLLAAADAVANEISKYMRGAQ
jgi:integrase